MGMDIKAQKSEAFALKIIDLYKFLVNERKEFVISKQILRSATSIGANIVESEYAESPNDFVHKLTIAQKETSETLYWLRLLGKSQQISDTYYKALYNDCQELLRIITAIILSMKSKQNKSQTYNS